MEWQTGPMTRTGKYEVKFHATRTSERLLRDDGFAYSSEGGLMTMNPQHDYASYQWRFICDLDGWMDAPDGDGEYEMKFPDGSVENRKVIGACAGLIGDDNPTTPVIHYPLGSKWRRIESKPAQTKFYAVCSNMHEHFDLSKATAEAEELARKTPGKKFYVMEAKSVVIGGTVEMKELV